MLVPPRPAALATAPYWAFHPLGVERRRADTVRRVNAVAPRLEEAVHLPVADAHRRLRAVPGVGAWTAAEVAIVALRSEERRVGEEGKAVGGAEEWDRVRKT